MAFVCSECRDVARMRTIRKCKATTSVDGYCNYIEDGKPAPVLMGRELKRLIAKLGFDAAKCFTCGGLARKMNEWGIEGCREHGEEIIEHLRKAYAAISWAEWLTAIAKATASGLALKINPLDPLGSLLDESERIATAQAAATSHKR